MKNKLLFFVIVLCNLLCYNYSSIAAVRLPSLVGNNMVLQQNTNVRVWGWTTPKNRVELSATWLSDRVSTRSDGNGLWEFFIPTPVADHQQHVMMINDGEPLSIYNIMFGEVWVAGGQSNMKYPIGGLWDTVSDGNNKTIAESTMYPEIRFFTVVEDSTLEPQENCRGEWQISIPYNVQEWSATAYYFALMINRCMNVPIGIINSSWGGTIIEAWMPKDDLAAFSDVDYTPITNHSKPLFTRPYMMYNAMIKPLTKYTIKGFLFYQGCSNVWTAGTYTAKLRSLVDRWRSDWGLGELPFYYVEIAPFDYGTDNIQGAFLREAQAKAQQLIPNSGMVSIYDLCADDEPTNAHPKNKRGVGERLAYYALSRTYGQAGVCSSYPTYRAMRTDGNKLYLSFDIADGRGLYPWTNLKGFEIAGSDGVFVEAEASLQLSTREIVVSSSAILSPTQVRYCFNNLPNGNVTNLRGLPLVPFRTNN